MTIKDYIRNKLLESGKERLEKLVEISAPEIVITGQKKFIENIKSGNIEISGDTDTLSDAFETIEAKKGKGGKTYYVFNGSINFFPKARYGMFIKRA